MRRLTRRWLAMAGLTWGLTLGGGVAQATLPDGPVTGMADKLPLEVVVREIVPPGIPVGLDDGVDKHAPASFKSGTSWQATLRGAIAPLGYVVTIDDERVFVALPPKPVPLIPQKEPPKKVDAPKEPAWTTIPKTHLRDQVALWLQQANGDACQTPEGICYRLVDPSPNDPVEPWKIGVSDTYHGDLLGALTWLRDGFWKSPRPDIEVTKNRMIIIRAIGAP